MLSMRISVALLAGALTAGQAVAAPAAGTSPPQTNSSAPRQAPLPPGGAASIQRAQGVGRPLLYWGAAGAVIITGVILLGQGDDNNTATTTTTGN